MSLHEVEFSYYIPEWTALQIDMDAELDQTEKESIALAEIKEIYDDIHDIEILKIREIS